MEALAERVGSGVESPPALPSRSRPLAGAPAAELDFGARATYWVNCLLALLALLVLVPILLLIAVAIKLTSRGRVLYTQERVGLDRRIPGADAGNHRRTRDLGGRPFTIYKFRTMRENAEHESGAVWATQNDPRITPVGR
ncbi:MAG: sugar transferase, partial [Gemmatimonadales bacterium]|nr:sugar transferase [Gemmatimonadales bacterium]